MPRVRYRVPSLKYPDVLAEAWEAAHAPRAEKAPTLISTFAGCGGSSLGYAMAGFEERLAVEWEANAAETFRRNFPNVPVFEGDIADLSVDEALERSGLEPGELDCFDGSPPCQGFSMAGKRILDDPRNALFREFCRLLRGLHPRAFVMENVAGMARGKMRLVFADALRALRDCGYRVECRLLRADFFQVPQARPRVIFIGIREDLEQAPAFPKPVSPPFTVRDALERVPADPPELKQKGLSGQALDIWRQIHRRESFSRHHPKGHWFNATKLERDRPAPTIAKLVMPTGPAGLFHWYEPRVLTIAEAKRIGSFPDPFLLLGKFQERWARIGNSVPPLFMRAIAREVRRVLEEASR